MRLDIYHHCDSELSAGHKLDALITIGRQIMSAISDFVTKQKAFNLRQDAAVANILGDLKTLNDKIEALQNSAGTITPEDQALLDEIEAHSDTITTNLEALDAQTPPVPPA